MLIRCLLFGLLMLTTAPVAASAESPRREVVYYGDRHLSLPQTVTRVATSWEAQNSIIAMLGYGDRIVATTRIVRSMPVFRKFVPSIVNASLAGTGGAAGISVEEMLALRPDILFVPDMLPPAKMEQLTQAGIAVAAFHYNSIDAIVERTLITGEIFGGEALDIARRYATYFESNRRRVRERLERIPPAARLKVYLASGSPLSTSGRPSLNQDWMDLGGAINVAENWFHDRPNASGTAILENIVASDPDVIITPACPRCRGDPQQPPMEHDQGRAQRACLRQSARSVLVVPRDVGGGAAVPVAREAALSRRLHRYRYGRGDARLLPEFLSYRFIR